MKLNNPKKVRDRDLVEISIEDPPHTVISHTLLTPTFSISLKVDLREILSKAENDDVLRITLGDSCTKFTLIRPLGKDSEERQL